MFKCFPLRFRRVFLVSSTAGFRMKETDGAMGVSNQATFGQKAAGGAQGFEFSDDVAPVATVGLLQGGHAAVDPVGQLFLDRLRHSVAGLHVVGKLPEGFGVFSSG